MGFKTHVKNLIDNVYKRWEFLSELERKFYSTFLDLISKNRIIPQFEYKDTNMDNVRINLKKNLNFKLEDDDAESRIPTLFSTTLPLVDNSYDLIFYNKDGAKLTLSKRTYSPAILRELYDTVYFHISREKSIKTYD